MLEDVCNVTANIVRGGKATERSGYERSWLAATQVYVNSGWSEMTATHKNVNEDIRDKEDERRNTRTDTEWILKRPGFVRAGLDNVPLRGVRQ